MTLRVMTGISNYNIFFDNQIISLNFNKVFVIMYNVLSEYQTEFGLSDKISKN